jgi:hypothetical protein
LDLRTGEGGFDRFRVIAAPRPQHQQVVDDQARLLAGPEDAGGHGGLDEQGHAPIIADRRRHPRRRSG